MELDGLTLAGAFKAVIDQNTEFGRMVRHTHFFEGLLLQPRAPKGKRSAEDNDEGPKKKTKGEKGNKGKGKGQPSTEPRERQPYQAPKAVLDFFDWADRSDLLQKEKEVAGKRACWGYNRGSCRKGKGVCDFGHFCLHCQAKHPVVQCPKARAAWKARS